MLKFFPLARNQCLLLLTLHKSLKSPKALKLKLLKSSLSLKSSERSSMTMRRL